MLLVNSVNNIYFVNKTEEQEEVDVISRFLSSYQKRGDDK